MKKFVLAIFVCLHSLGHFAQDTTSIDGAVNLFFNAIQDSLESRRSASIKALCLPNASMNAITMRTANSARLATGDVDDFIANSGSFYDQFKLTIDEFDRSVSYYADMAVISSLVYQTNTRKSDGQAFELTLWYTIDLVFQNGRWYVASVNWTSSFSSDPIESAQESDTLWHKKSGR